MAYDPLVHNSPSSWYAWDAGDGYAVDDWAAHSYQMQQNYYGGNDTPIDQRYRSLLTDSIDVSNPTPNYGSGGNTLGAATSILGATAGNSGAVWGAALGTASDIYNNSTTDTAGSVLGGVGSGAATGAMVGTYIFPGVGTAVGAVAGGIIGGIIGLFGSKSKKKQAKQEYQAKIQEAIAPQQQAQANWLQQQGLTSAAISPYGKGYTPGGFQFKNSLIGGNTSNIPQPQSGSLQLPSGPPTGNVNKVGGSINWNIPNASFVPSGGTGMMTPPSTSFAPPSDPSLPMMPKWSGNKSKDQANANAYAAAMAEYYNNQRLQASGAALGNYSPFFNQG